MRIILIHFLFLLTILLSGQSGVSTLPAKSIFHKVKPGDSITVYQCHVEEVKQSISTQAGQTFTSEGKCTITEKYVITRNGDEFSLRYYTTALNVFPNKKFSGLKISERPYWQFMYQKNIPVLSSMDLKVFTALEAKGIEAIEYDYGITKYTRNQVIFRHRRDFRQLVIPTGHVISRLIAL